MKKINLSIILTVTIILSISAVFASDVNNTDSHINKLVEDKQDISSQVDNAADSLKYSDSNSKEVLKSENSNSIATTSENNNLNNNNNPQSSNTPSLLAKTKTIQGPPVTKYYKGNKKYTVKFLNYYGNALSNTKVKVTVNGRSYTKKTNANGIVSLSVNYKPGTYKIVSKNPRTGYKLNSYVKILSTISSKNIAKVRKDNRKFSATFLNRNGKFLAKKVIKFRLKGKIYKVKTNNKGVAQLSLINLKPGTYKIVSYNRDGLSKTNKIKVYKKVGSKLITSTYTFNKNDSSKTIKVTLYNSLGYAITKSKTIKIKINGKTYSKKTNTKGIAFLKLPSLNYGTYTVSYKFSGDTYYKGSSASNKVVITQPKTPKNKATGYWVWSTNMKNVDLKDLSSKGVTDILLNFKAYTTYGKSELETWISEAKTLGINVHLWVQAFYENNTWTNPIQNGTENTEFFNKKINEIKNYASIKGIAGIHLDYLRYPGTAYKTVGGTNAISDFVKQVTDAIKSINSNLIVSAALMPETTSNEYYYGQDYSALSSYLDVVIPMVYKGNYRKDSSWIGSTTKWYVDNSKGAKVWVGLQTYYSDSNPEPLPLDELNNDINIALNNNADGVILFRYAKSPNVDFNYI